MPTGKVLLELKSKSKAANIAYHNMNSTRGLLFFATSMLALGALPAGLIGIVFARNAENPIVGPIFAAIGVVSLIATSFLGADSKKIKTLYEVMVTTQIEYWSALTSEMREYGIDTSSMEARNGVHDDALEFTASCNDVLSDITVRTFGNELVLMMNGERMTKKSTVGV